MKLINYLLKMMALLLLYLIPLIKYRTITSTRKFYQRIALTCVCLLFSLNIYANNEDFLVKTVDSSGNEFHLSSITWWAVNTPKNKKIIRCQKTACSEWIFPKGQSGLIFISASTSKKSSVDELCWDFYSGSTYIDIDIDLEHLNEIVLSLEIQAKACS